MLLKNSLAIAIFSLVAGIPSSAISLAQIGLNPDAIESVAYPPSSGGRRIATVIVHDHKVLSRRAPLPDPRREEAERLIADMAEHKEHLDAGEYGEAALAATKIHASDYGSPDDRLIRTAAQVAEETGADVTVGEIVNVVRGKRL